jgi:hypothetical protein
MDKFKVGQRVRIIKATLRKDLIGQIVHITGPKRIYHYPHTNEDLPAYPVDVAPKDGYNLVAFEESYLEPVYDGDEKSSWDECAWKPLNVPLPT